MTDLIKFIIFTILLACVGYAAGMASAYADETRDCLAPIKINQEKRIKELNDAIKKAIDNSYKEMKKLEKNNLYLS